MGKKNTFTIVGMIILSLVLPVGGYVITSRLIDMEWDRLLSETTYLPMGNPRTDSTIIHPSPDTPLHAHEVRIIVSGEIIEQLGVIKDNVLILPFQAIADALGETSTSQPEFAEVRDVVEALGIDEIFWDTVTQTIYITRK